MMIGDEQQENKGLIIFMCYGIVQPNLPVYSPNNRNPLPFFQDFPDHLLPEVFRNDNPLNILRLVDGEWTNKKKLS